VWCKATSTRALRSTKAATPVEAGCLFLRRYAVERRAQPNRAVLNGLAVREDVHVLRDDVGRVRVVVVVLAHVFPFF